MDFQQYISGVCDNDLFLGWDWDIRGSRKSFLLYFFRIELISVRESRKEEYNASYSLDPHNFGLENGFLVGCRFCMRSVPTGNFTFARGIFSSPQDCGRRSYLSRNTRSHGSQPTEFSSLASWRWSFWSSLEGQRAHDR
jgi:hypothetical protein